LGLGGRLQVLRVVALDESLGLGVLRETFLLLGLAKKVRKFLLVDSLVLREVVGVTGDGIVNFVDALGIEVLVIGLFIRQVGDGFLSGVVEVLSAADTCGFREEWVFVFLARGVDVLLVGVGNLLVIVRDFLLKVCQPCGVLGVVVEINGGLLRWGEGRTRSCGNSKVVLDLFIRGGVGRGLRTQQTQEIGRGHTGQA
jgi:hypothetical protein